MIFDEACRLAHNHDHALVKLHACITPAFGQEKEEQAIQH